MVNFVEGNTSLRLLQVGDYFTVDHRPITGEMYVLLNKQIESNDVYMGKRSNAMCTKIAAMEIESGVIFFLKVGTKVRKCKGTKEIRPLSGKFTSSKWNIKRGISVNKETVRS